VALDGSLVLRGIISHPVDDDGIYPCPVSDHVRISRTFGTRLVRCQATRDISGFLTKEEFGGEVQLPEPIAFTLIRAFSVRVKEPIVLRLDQQAGFLADSTSRESRLCQPLSDWSLTIEERDDDLHVALSAKLYGAKVEEWQKNSTANHWQRQPSARIDIQFVLDAITRTACFGCYSPSISTEGTAAASLPAPAKLTELDISTAPVGEFVQCGVAPDRLVSIHESAELGCLSLDRRALPKRTPAGFLATTMTYVWPRLTLYGITMASLRFALRSNPSLRLTAEGDQAGHLHYGGSDGEIINVTGWTADIKRDEVGLHFDIEALSTRTPQRLIFRLPWETLILRYPGLLPPPKASTLDRE
jgi:hypothetical protein